MVERGDDEPGDDPPLPSAPRPAKRRMTSSAPPGPDLGPASTPPAPSGPCITGCRVLCLLPTQPYGRLSQALIYLIARGAATDR
jgi:hypothetical protein